MSQKRGFDIGSFAKVFQRIEMSGACDSDLTQAHYLTRPRHLNIGACSC
jgi:hypothetical protein